MTTKGEGRRDPQIHLWTYNHLSSRISDQVDYFVQAFQQHGYCTSVGRKPAASALNVVIENFSVRTRKTLIDFCTDTQKRVAVIMTEHIDFQDRQVLVHGEPLGSPNDYMRHAAQVERLECLMSCQPYIRFFMVLGDLPQLRNFGEMMVGADVRAIPFPEIDRKSRSDVQQCRPGNDLLFTGAVTEYREKLLLSVVSRGFSVAFPRRFSSREQRDQLNQSAKIVLNIPQREHWPWLSLMRIMAALRCGRATVSLGTSDRSCIAACTYQLDLQRADWTDQLRTCVEKWDAVYEEMHDAYCQLAETYEREHPFPHDMMEFWAITDRI